MEDKPQQCVIPLHKPSLRELVFFFFSGVLVSIPFAVVFEQLTSTFISTALLVIVLAPFIEELAKVFPLFYRHGETERSLVTLGILIGLGFGVSEFFLYVFIYDVPWIVRIPGVIFHASTAAVTAYGIAKKKPLGYYLISVTLHASNNFFAVYFVTEATAAFGVLAELIILVIVYLLAWHFYHKASTEKMVV